MRTRTDIVREFRGKRALVLGDVMLDSYFEGTAERLCAEGPVPVVRRTAASNFPGGAGNVAANMKSLGADVMLVGLTGYDSAGDELRQVLRSQGIEDTWLVADPSLSTLHKRRILADGQYVVRFDDGDTASPSAASQDRLLNHLEEGFGECDAILVSDYAYGVCNPEIIDRLAKMQRTHRRVLVIDSKQLQRYSRVNATIVTPNEREANLLAFGETRKATSTHTDRAEIAERVLERTGARFVTLTLANDGVLVAGRSRAPVHIPAQPVHDAFDVGAGDTFAAALTLALAADADVTTTARIGVLAASIAVCRPNTSTVDYQELLQRSSVGDLASLGDLEPISDIVEKLDRLRLSGHTIVFTNGVFDILHAGHVEFLRQAKHLGDVLVVGVNSDSSARRLKGANRPVISERDRLSLVRALDAVDYALLFDDEDPSELIRRIRPHLHVKGGDYAGTYLPEAEAVRQVGGRIAILPLVGSLSTSSVIDRILTLSTSASEFEAIDA